MFSELHLDALCYRPNGASDILKYDSAKDLCQRGHLVITFRSVSQIREKMGMYGVVY